MTEITLARVLKSMNTLVAQKQEIESQLKTVRDKMAELEAHALAMMGEITDSQKVEGRTWFKKVQTNFTIADADIFTQWAIANGNVDFLQKRLATTNVREFLESSGQLPPGVNSFSTLKLGHRS